MSGFKNSRDSQPTKVEIDMKTDVGEVKGQLLADRRFVNQLKAVSDKQTNKNAKMAAI